MSDPSASPNGGTGGGGVNLPSLVALHKTPLLFVIMLSYILMIGAITYLVAGRSASQDKDRAELIKLIQDCQAKLVDLAEKKK